MWSPSHRGVRLALHALLWCRATPLHAPFAQGTPESPPVTDRHRHRREVPNRCGGFRGRISTCPAGDDGWSPDNLCLEWECCRGSRRLPQWRFVCSYEYILCLSSVV